ncbi:hypothetical protein [Muricoccus radiodurans]|uniref:hypothetical protein n=1 Tax=Muricoccus radiodurans TaxID=2231721 RepID=UPI003CE73218
MTETEGLAEIAPGTLWALGGWLRMEEAPVSWIPLQARGWLPVQGYALRDGSSWLMVDTGLAVHWPLVAEGVRRTSAGCGERRLITTRREQDCMNGIPALVREFGLREVLYAGVLNPLDFYEGVEEAEAAGRIEANGVAATRIAPGVVTRIGTLELEVLRTELRLLATNWFYERRTRTLFTSDAFAFLARAEPGMSRLRSPGEPPMRAEEAASFLSAKMDWLIGVDPAPVIADLDRIQEGWPAERICPGFGLVIEGPAAVAEAFDVVRDALRRLGGRPRRPWSLPAGLDEVLG